MALDIDDLEYLAINLTGMYNFFPPGPLTQSATLYFCELRPEVCAFFVTAFADLDLKVDNWDRYATYLTHVPSGSGYRNFVHFA